MLDSEWILREQQVLHVRSKGAGTTLWPCVRRHVPRDRREVNWWRYPGGWIRSLVVVVSDLWSTLISSRQEEKENKGMKSKHRPKRRTKPEVFQSGSVKWLPPMI